MGWSVAQLAWTAIACALALAGLWCVVRGLWRRSLGRIKPCPKCGYDLAATATLNASFLCPECGTTSPVHAVVSRHPRRWLVALTGVLLLLLVEPAWRMPKVPQPDGSRSWLAIAPTWTLACVLPIPNPVKLDTTALQLWPLPAAAPATLSFAARARNELDTRWQSGTLEHSRSSIWATIYARRFKWLWNGTPITSENDEPQTVHIFSLDRIYPAKNRSGDSWETSLRRLLAARHSTTTPFDESLLSRTAEPLELEALDTIFPTLISSPRFGSSGFVLSNMYSASSEPLGSDLVVLTIRPDLQERLTPAWNALNDFYTQAGPDTPEVHIADHEDGSVRAYWVADMCQRPQQVGERVDLVGLPHWAFISTMHEWLNANKITDGYLQAWCIDPAGQILILRGDARMHEHIRAFIASRRTSP
jgi:predicted RNA-binding Zn-ribbon protein involved in translation (DUF1610 family)